ncbi:helix-turn-helix domain-containing protein [Photorhabdus bodei]
MFKKTLVLSEQLVATALNCRPSEIWPSRYLK